MKVNTNRSRAKKGMRYLGHTKNRPEQLLAAKLIKLHLKTPMVTYVETEELVQCFNPDEPGKEKEISVDITVVIPRQRGWSEGIKVAIELNGPPHDEMPQIRRDTRKQIILEWPGNNWKFLVFDYNKMPILFTRATRELDYDEIVKAYGEIIIAVGNALPLRDPIRRLIESV